MAQGSDLKGAHFPQQPQGRGSSPRARPFCQQPVTSGSSSSSTVPALSFTHTCAWRAQSKSPKGAPVTLSLGGRSVLPTCSDCWGHLLPKVCIQSNPGLQAGQDWDLVWVRATASGHQELPSVATGRATPPAHPQEVSEPQGSGSGTRPALTPHR